MAELYRASVMHVTAGDKVEVFTLGEYPRDHMNIDLPGGVSLFFEGYGSESEANLLGFLDQMHAIRNSLMQDIADRQLVKEG